MKIILLVFSILAVLAGIVAGIMFPAQRLGLMLILLGLSVAVSACLLLAFWEGRR